MEVIKYVCAQVQVCANNSSNTFSDTIRGVEV